MKKIERKYNSNTPETIKQRFILLYSKTKNQISGNPPEPYHGIRSYEI